MTGMLLALLTLPMALALEKPDEPEEQAVYPVAILPFVERQKSGNDTGRIVSDILFANLATDPAILLVDREDLDKVLEEQGMNISGIVDSAGAVKVGHVIGAKVLVTGSVLKAGSFQYLVAKIIGTETSRVFGASVKGDEKEDINLLADEIVNLAESPALMKSLQKNVKKEYTRITWGDVAKKCLRSYNRVMKKGRK